MRIGQATWGGGYRRSTFDSCSFDGSHFRSIAPGNARFINCSFTDVSIPEFYAHDIELIDCTFSGCLEKGFVNGSRDRKRLRFFDRRRNTITGNDFSGCELRDFSFRTGVDLSKQVLPKGEAYLYLANPTQAISYARIIVADWGDPELRRLAGIVLDVWERELKDGQEQIFCYIPPHGEFAGVYKELGPIVMRASA